MLTYKVTKEFEEKTNPFWMELLKNQRIVQYTWINEDRKAQLEDHWDVGVVFYGSRSPVRIDLKTRTEKYFPHYQKDNKIVIEIQGNTEKEDSGSSIFNSNSDLWACAWFVKDRLQCPFVFDRKGFAEWLGKYGVENFKEIKSNTENKYNTKSILVDDKFFTPFLDKDLNWGMKF